MRCPHCRGEIPPESQFCGVCGQNIHVAHIGTPPQGGPSHSLSQGGGDSGLSPSLFDLPVSKGARAIRVGMIVGLNLLMLGGAIALFMGYINKRDRAAAKPTTVVEPSAKGTETPEVSEPGVPLDGGSVAPSSTGEGAAKKLAKTDSGSQPKDSTAPAPKTGSDGGTRSPSTSTGSTNSSGSTAAPAKRGVDGGVPRPTPETPQPRTPDAGPGAPTVEPVLTEEEQARQVQIVAGKIGLVVESHQGQLARCYENSLKQAPRDPLEGRIDLHFSIQPDGSAKGIRVRSNSTGSALLANCLVGLVGSWTFPSSGSEALDFVWPFEFQSPK